MRISNGVRLGHVNLEVIELRRARQFYDRFLSVIGYDRLPSEDPYWSGYAKGRTAIWVTVSRPRRVVRKTPHAPTDGVQDPISDHIGFATPTAKRVEQLDAAPCRRGFRAVYSTTTQKTRGGWYTSSAWKDPDNNVLEIYAVTRSRTRAK